MRKRTLVLAGLTGAAVAAAATLTHRAERVEAADHSDSPAASLNETADLTDFFAWTYDDAGEPSLALILNVFRDAPASATFATNVLYVAHVDRGGTETLVACQFDSTDNTAARCWVGDSASSVFLDGDPTNAASPLTVDGVKVFAGQRDDPFFFNSDGFSATTSAVQDLCVVQNGCGAVLDGNGCPNLSVDVDATDDFPSLGEALANCLTTMCDAGVGDNSNAAAINNFAGDHVLSLVVSVPLSLIDGTGDTLVAYGSTHSIQ